MSRPKLVIVKLKLPKAKTTDFLSMLKFYRKIEVEGIGTFDLRTIKAKKTTDHWNNKEYTVPGKIKIHYTSNKETEKEMQ